MVRGRTLLAGSLVRDTKGRDGETLAFTAAAWQTFASSLK
jgi:hypothetical protein